MERVFPWRERALLQHLLCFLRGEDVHALAQTHRVCSCSILPILQQYTRRAGRLALALWCLRHLRVEFQSFYQILETQRIPRSASHDPRVPPRVVSFWSERGKVEGGGVTLAPSSLPLVHRDGVTARFAVDASEKPMLMSVAQTQRRIYTTVTVKLHRGSSRSASSGDGDDAVTTLRQYSYIKEFGEWIAPSPAEKRLYDQRSGGKRGALCRYDLHSRDGSVALELDVPSGADSLMDYYLVKSAVVNIHMAELLQHYVQSVRPPRELPATAQPVACSIALHFRALDGAQQCSYSLSGLIGIERQQQDEATSSSNGSASGATAMEHFDIITCKALAGTTATTTATSAIEATPKVELPTDPGYLWLRMYDAQSKQIYYHVVILHQGATTSRGVATMRTQWLPGVLEFFPTIDSRQRRCLKGHLTIASSAASGELQELTVVAQHIGASRLERYAAALQSCTRIEA